MIDSKYNICTPKSFLRQSRRSFNSLKAPFTFLNGLPLNYLVQFYSNHNGRCARCTATQSLLSFTEGEDGNCYLKSCLDSTRAEPVFPWARKTTLSKYIYLMHVLGSIVSRRCSYHNRTPEIYHMQAPLLRHASAPLWWAVFSPRRSRTVPF